MPRHCACTLVAHTDTDAILLLRRELILDHPAAQSLLSMEKTLPKHQSINADSDSGNERTQSDDKRNI